MSMGWGGECKSLEQLGGSESPSLQGPQWMESLAQDSDTESHPSPQQSHSHRIHREPAAVLAGLLS